MRPTPPTVYDAIVLMFEGQTDQAARRLMIEQNGDEAAHSLQYLLAERITAHIPDILLLRPNLYRLEVALARPGRRRHHRFRAARLSGGHLRIAGRTGALQQRQPDHPARRLPRRWSIR